MAALLESHNEESLEEEEPGLAALAGASIVGRVAEGPNAGQRVKTAGIDIRERDLEESFGSRAASQPDSRSRSACARVEVARRRLFRRP